MLTKISDETNLQGIRGERRGKNRRERRNELPLSNSDFAPWFCQKMVLFFIALLTIVLFSSHAWAIRAIGGDSQIRVSWIAPSKNVDGTPLVDLAGYNIYRGITREEQTEKINHDFVSGCTFVDSGLKNGQTYFYTVKAVDFSGNESPPSDVTFATPSILPPSGFTVIGDDSKVKLFWEACDNLEVRGYHVYRTQKQGQDYQKITSVPIECAYFEDLNVVNGLNYYYVISSVCEDSKESPYSEEKGVTPIALIPLEPSDLKATYELNVVKLEWPPASLEKERLGQGDGETTTPSSLTSSSLTSSSSQVTGYHVYRRNSLEEKKFQRLTEQPVTGNSYVDDTIEENMQYLYSVVGVDSQGRESKFPMEVNCYTRSLYIASVTEDTEGKARKAGDKIVIVMRGEPGCQATFAIEGLAENQPLSEVNLGIYTFEFTVPAGTNLTGAELSGYLADTQGNKAMKVAASKISIKNDPPPPVLAISGEVNAYGWPEIKWTPPDVNSYLSVEILRSLSADDPVLPVESASSVKKGVTTYVDEKADAGSVYYYMARTVDEAGNRSKNSEVVKIDLRQNGLGQGPVIFSVTDDTLGVPVKTGRIIKVAVEGDRGCDAFFSLKEVEASSPDKGTEASTPAAGASASDAGASSQGQVQGPAPTDGKPASTDGKPAPADGKELIQWQPLQEIRPGVYKGEYEVKDSDQTSEKGAGLIVKLVEIHGAKIERFAKGETLIRINVLSDDKEPPLIKKVEHNGQSTSGFSGKLVAGDVLCVHLTGDPGEIAFFSLGPDGKKIAMQESRITAGVYEGSYTIRYGDEAKQGFRDLGKTASSSPLQPKHLQPKPLSSSISVYGYLSDQAGNVASKASENPVAIDTHLIITVEPRQKDLAADNKGQTEVAVKVSDINKNPVSGHHIALTLSTTDEYTDVIGGGNFGREIDGKLAIDYEDVTDNFGQIKATYTVGFAAKTALIIAKDLDTGQAGVGYITSHIESFLDILLRARERNLGGPAAGPGDAASMILEADPQKITADGRSRARITVRLLDNGGNPVVKPYQVTFFPSNEEGRLSKRAITTNAAGSGYVYYEAGKRIGTVVISAIARRGVDPDNAPQLTADASIILMSDAPAKLIMLADTDHLDAGSGQSARISINVTDINDNPNPEATVQLRLQDAISEPGAGAGAGAGGHSSRNGELSDTAMITDRNGETSCTYRAGQTPGVVRIMAKVCSKIPNEEKELLRAQGSLFVPLWEKEEEASSFARRWADDEAKNCRGTLREWFKAEGDEVKKGEPLARIEIDRHGEVIVKAPGDGRLTGIKVLRGEEARIGQTVGFMEIEEEKFPY